MREFLRESDNPELSRYAVLREAKTHVVGPMCHVLWRFTTGDAFGANMMTRNAYALNMAYVLPQAPVPIERTILEANMGGDKKPSFEYFQQGHGKTVIAETTLTEAAIERVLRTTRRRPRGARLGRDARRRRLRDAVGRVHAGLGDRGGLRGDRPGSRARRHELDGARDRAACRGRPPRRRSASPGSRSGTVGGGTTLPDPRRWLELMGCAGPGKVYRLAQLVAATALALEISASAAMATAGQRELLPRPLRARRPSLVRCCTTRRSSSR